MKQIICCMLLCINTLLAYACNTCGSSSSGQSLGLLPSVRQHFIGLQYQQRSFNSVHKALSESKPDEHSEEYYNTLQLWGKWNATDRIQVFAFVPYHHNLQEMNGAQTITSGLGDISALVNVVVLRNTSDKQSSVLIAGAGIKAPTGKYNSLNIQNQKGLPNMQAGTGTWDYVANANYTWQSRNWGANAEVSYTLTTAAKDAYKYGNRLSTGATAFYRWQKGSFSLLPQAGMRYEFALHDYDNYKRKWLNEQTGGYHLFGSIGLQAYYKKTGLQLSYLHPLRQQFAAGNVNAGYFATAGLFLLL